MVSLDKVYSHLKVVAKINRDKKGVSIKTHPIMIVVFKRKENTILTVLKSLEHLTLPSQV